MSDNFFDVEDDDQEQKKTEEKLQNVRKKKVRDLSLPGFIPSGITFPSIEIGSFSTRTLFAVSIEVLLAIYLVLAALGQAPLF